MNPPFSIQPPYKTTPVCLSQLIVFTSPTTVNILTPASPKVNLLAGQTLDFAVGHCTGPQVKCPAWVNVLTAWAHSWGVTNTVGDSWGVLMTPIQTHSFLITLPRTLIRTKVLNSPCWRCQAGPQGARGKLWDIW